LDVHLKWADAEGTLEKQFILTEEFSCGLISELRALAFDFMEDFGVTRSAEDRKYFDVKEKKEGRSCLCQCQWKLHLSFRLPVMHLRNGTSCRI
jgi:hypothetical protein